MENLEEQVVRHTVLATEHYLLNVLPVDSDYWFEQVYLDVEDEMYQRGRTTCYK